ncbi:hypothetical protein NFI96_003007 [Prochilodus magdalenae]|nr:hypothetical protein NFI96_003007 [Prochilodus magdalenae]
MHGMDYHRTPLGTSTAPYRDVCRTTESITKEIVKCLQVSAPGPHVFLLVLQVGRFTPEEQNAVQCLLELFGEEASKYMIVVFTHGDLLENQSIEDYMRHGPPQMRKVVQTCGSRYVVFNNNDMKKRINYVCAFMCAFVSVNTTTHQGATTLYGRRGFESRSRWQMLSYTNKGQTPNTALAYL